MTNSANLPNNNPEQQPQGNSPESQSAEIQPAQPLDQAPPEEVQEVGREAMKTMAAEIRAIRETTTEVSPILKDGTVDTQVQIIATQQLNNIPFEYLISAPLSGAVNAQAKAAGETMTFIESVGFKDGKLRSVEFKYNRLKKKC